MDEDDLADQHHQLVMAFNDVMKYCEQLVENIDKHISDLQRNVAGTLDRASKLKLLSRTAGIAKMEKMIESQTSVMTLLLAACAW